MEWPKTRKKPSLEGQSIDQEIVDRILAGVTPAETELTERYRSKIQSFAKRIYFYRSGNEYSDQCAEDVAQKVLLKAVTNLGKYDARKATFSTWIYHMTYTCLVDEYRKAHAKKRTNKTSVEQSREEYEDAKEFVHGQILT